MERLTQTRSYELVFIVDTDTIKLHKYPYPIKSDIEYETSLGGICLESSTIREEADMSNCSKWFYFD